MKFGIRELILVSAMIALLICSYLFVFTKANAKRVKMEQDIVTWRKEMANVDQKTAGKENIERRVAELQKAIDFFQQKLPKEREVEKILQEITPIAEANSLQCKSVKTLKTERGSSYCEQPIQLALEGEFRGGLYAFLIELEKLPRITRITQMKVEKINERDGDAKATLTMSIFFEGDNLTTASAK
jgi:type IV pilus assembly protein PilO